jgi:hypothetical protein
MLHPGDQLRTLYIAVLRRFEFDGRKRGRIKILPPKGESDLFDAERL